MQATIVSLFSGCGGLDLGFELTGQFKVVWGNDLYRPSAETFSKNFNLEISEKADFRKGTIFVGDVERVDFTKIGAPGEVDVVTGGPPCQDFSIIRGKRKGIRVKRGRLYVHFVRALVSLQPKMFVFENVKGLASANKGVAFKQILADFENLNLRWRSMWKDHREIIRTVRKTNHLRNYKIIFSSIVDFSKLGVPQQRERLIIIGLREDLIEKVSEQKIRSELLAKDFFPLTPIEVLDGKTLNDLEDRYRNIMEDYREVGKEIYSERSRQYFSNIWKNHRTEVWKDYEFANSLPAIDQKEKIIESHAKILLELGYLGKPVDKLTDNKILNEKETVKLRMNFIPPGENHEFVKGTPYGVAGLMSNIYRRIHPLKPAPTIIARGGGGTWGYHYLRNRQRLTNRERARLQTFPDSFLFYGSPSEVRRQIGEAVPPLAAKRIAKVILSILEEINSDKVI